MSDLRLANASDRSRLERFLYEHAATSMYQLAHFLNGRGQFWVNDPLTNVLCLAPDGMLQPVFTHDPVQGLSAALSGQRITGVVGTRQSVEMVKAVIDVPNPTLDRVETGYAVTLPLAHMRATDGLTLLPYRLAPRADVIAMRAAYYIEALDVLPAEAPARAIAHFEAGLETDGYRVLMQGDTLLALTGFNTEVGDIVMIGGVYTPPEHRGKGYAGTAIAMHLAAAHARGIERAVLSAANKAAARAYEKIGFEQMCEFSITVLEQPVIIRG